MTNASRQIRRRKSPVSRTLIRLLFAVAVPLIGCTHDLTRVYGVSGASPHPETAWTPPKQAIQDQNSLRAKDTASRGDVSGIPRTLLNNINSLALADIVNIALLNNKQTRQAWSLARAAAASYGSRAGSYYPDISGTAFGGNEQNPSLGPAFAKGAWSYSATASLSWLVFDFGGRSASVRESREALFAADFSHNATIQNVILQVEQAYYNYFAAKGLLAAEQSAVDEAATNLNATNDRHAAGLSTIADVLQAKTALSQSTLTLESLRGQIATTRGSLATAMGLAATISFDVELPVGTPPAETRKDSIQKCLEVALQERPDLAGSRAAALEADAHAWSVRTQGFPSVAASAGVGRAYITNVSNGSTTYDAGITVNVPIFSGFSHHFDALAAAAQADAARANAQNVKDLVTLQVWTSFYNLETADQMVRTSADLLASASENHDVALGRYKSGVGSILDLLTAQAALESARAQQIQAHASWWLALAQLSHDMGVLEAGAQSSTAIPTR